jgi:hypothetical protein
MAALSLVPRLMACAATRAFPPRRPSAIFDGKRLSRWWRGREFLGGAYSAGPQAPYVNIDLFLRLEAKRRLSLSQCLDGVEAGEVRPVMV